MATETTTRLIDDLDGSPADRTVAFSWDGRSYEVDLNKKNLNGLEKALKPYVSAARRSSGSGRSARRGLGRAGNGRRADLQAIRDWAAENGHVVADRGRISQAVVDAYDAAR